jgi:hypothetical protein
MNHTYLVQRLKSKPTSAFMAKATQVFGGGALLLKDEAWNLLQQVFDFDPMGAAEYEFGIIPKVLGALVRDSVQLVTHELTLTRDEIAINYSHKFVHQRAREKELDEAKKAGVKAKRAKPLKLPPLTKTVYVLCRADHLQGAIEVIRKMALDKLYTKNSSNFASTLDPDARYSGLHTSLRSDLIGWLELDNGFFFFLDKEAFNGTRDIFMGKQET